MQPLEGRERKIMPVTRIVPSLFRDAEDTAPGKISGFAAHAIKLIRMMETIDGSFVIHAISCIICNAHCSGVGLSN